MNILPYQDEYFVQYRTKSVQYFRLDISNGISSQIFCHFREKYQNIHKTKCCDKAFKTADLKIAYLASSLLFIKWC